MTTKHSSLLRQRGSHESSKVGMVELFFDLVFVFAITQLSHRLLAHLDLEGILQTALLLLAVWWVWIYTSWVTNWLDPERLPVRLCLFSLMLAGLVLSSSIPKAFSAAGLIFAIAYVAMQMGRTLFFLWAVRNEGVDRRRNFQRILAWLTLSGLFWIAGGLAEDSARWTWWLIALAIEIVSPSIYFWVPGLGRSRTSDWDVDGHHMAERCGLFVIIALGESLLVTGATFSELEWSIKAISAFLAAFLGSLAMWWIYFDTGAERATKRFAHSEDPGRIARIAYTYLHVLIVAGIIVNAVADELMLMHPGHANGFVIAVIVGGPVLYLLGNALFKWVTNDRRGPPLSHVAGLLMLIALSILASANHFSALGTGMLTTGILIAVAAWETVAVRRSSDS